MILIYIAHGGLTNYYIVPFGKTLVVYETMGCVGVQLWNTTDKNILNDAHLLFLENKLKFVYNT